jgi:hypothetical protein
MRPEVVLDFYAKWFSPSRNVGGIVEEGDSGPHVENIITGLRELRYQPSSKDLFTSELASEVRRFQARMGHEHTDGRMGRRTRRLLVNELLDRVGAKFFREELKPTFPSFFQVFLSYARDDWRRVQELDQWLRDHGVSVSVDIRDFHPGEQISEEILANMNLSDKTVAILTERSRSRDWVAFEQSVACQIEKQRGERCLIYLLLDDVKPPSHDSNRINIVGTGIPLKEGGEAILHSATGCRAARPTPTYDETQPL